MEWKLKGPLYCIHQWWVNVWINMKWSLGSEPCQVKICASQSYGRGSRDVKNKRKLGGEGAREWKIIKWNREVEFSGQAPGEWSWLLTFYEVWLGSILALQDLRNWAVWSPFPLPPQPPSPDASVFSVLPFPQLGQGPHSLLPWHRGQCWHKVMIS